MPDEPVADTKKPARFIAEEVPSDAVVEVTTAPAAEPTPAAPAEPVEATAPPLMSHSASQFSAGVDTASLFPSSISEEPSKASSGNKGLVLLTVVLLVAALGVVGFILYNRSKSTEPEAAPVAPVTTSLTASPSPVTSASPSATFDRTKLKVKVQNGSGITGLASKAKTYLEDLGYLDVKTGNASSTDFEETEVAVKEEFMDISSSIVNDLKDEYTVASKVQTLDATEDFDVVITLGQN